MENALIFLHIALCAAAVCAGFVLFSDLIRRRFVKIQLCWFVRCSLGSNMVVLLLALLLAHMRTGPTVMIAMISVYATAVIVLAGRKFKLRGVWRNVFAFTLAFVLYFNVLDFMLQMFGPTALIVQFGRSLFLASQCVLVAFCIGLGTLAAQRLASMSAWKPSLSKN